MYVISVRTKEKCLKWIPTMGPQHSAGGGRHNQLIPNSGVAHTPEFLVIPKVSERGFLGVGSKLQNVKRELKNGPHVDSRPSLETKVSGPNPQLRRIPCDSQGFRKGIPGSNRVQNGPRIWIQEFARFGRSRAQKNAFSTKIATVAPFASRRSF